MERNKGKVPLERALSKLGAASRSQTRDWAMTGRLKVNGRTVTDPQFMVTPETDRFSVDGKPLVKDPSITLLFNKPGAVVTTRSDEKGRRTVFDLLPPEFQKLHAVGRLDMASTSPVCGSMATAMAYWGLHCLQAVSSSSSRMCCMVTSTVRVTLLPSWGALKTVPPVKMGLCSPS